MDIKLVSKLFEQHPLLAKILKAGVVGKKQIREMLDISKQEMDEIHKELILAEAVIGYNHSAFRANDELLDYIADVETGLKLIETEELINE